MSSRLIRMVAPYCSDSRIDGCSGVVEAMPWSRCSASSIARTISMVGDCIVRPWTPTSAGRAVCNRRKARSRRRTARSATTSGNTFRPADKRGEARREPLPGVTLIQSGGHFEGSAVLHWAGGAEGRGALFTGDTITVGPDRQFVSFMRSYPNLIPLPARELRRIVSTVEPYKFDRIYGGWWDRIIGRNAKAAIQKSADRYIRWIEGAPTLPSPASGGGKD